MLQKISRLRKGPLNTFSYGQMQLFPVDEADFKYLRRLGKYFTCGPSKRMLKTIWTYEKTFYLLKIGEYCKELVYETGKGYQYN